MDAGRAINEMVFAMLFVVAVANLFSKRIATIYGVSFTVLLYVVFLVSERANAGKRRAQRGLDLARTRIDAFEDHVAGRYRSLKLGSEPRVESFGAPVRVNLQRPAVLSPGFLDPSHLLERHAQIVGGLGKAPQLLAGVPRDDAAADVEHRLMRELVENSPGDGEPADTGVEDSDRGVVHDIPPYPRSRPGVPARARL